MAANRRETELVIRGKDEGAAKLFTDTAGRVKEWSRQLEDAKAKADALRLKVEVLEQATAESETTTKKQETTLKQANAEFERAEKKVNSLTAALDKNNQKLRDSAEAFRAQAAANAKALADANYVRDYERLIAQKEAEEAGKRNAQLVREAGFVEALNRELAQQLQIEKNLAAERRKAGPWGARPDANNGGSVPSASRRQSQEQERRQRNNQIGAFGLRPYELQNLGYQVNDVFTQLGSGAPVTQVFAQQAGQILQIFPGVIRGFTRYFAEIAAGAVVIGTLFAAMKRVYDLERTQRGFAAKSALSADGSAYDPERLAASARGAESQGLDIVAARDSIQELVSSGIPQAQIDKFLKTSRDLAKVLGLEVPTAAREFATAMSGGYEQLAAYDDKLNVLTVAEREHIRALFESGRAADARATAVDIFNRKASEAADLMRGPWSEAARELYKSWTMFLEAIADTGVVTVLATALDALSYSAKGLALFFQDIYWVAKKVSELDFSGAAFVAMDPDGSLGKVIQEQERLKGNSLLAGQLRGQLARVTPTGTSVASPVATVTGQESSSQAGQKRGADILTSLERQLELTKDLTGAEKVRQAGLEALQRVQAAGGTAEQAAQAKRLAEEREQIAVDRAAAERAKSAASAAEADARALDAKRDSVASALASSLGAVGNTGDATLEQRLDAITQKYDILADKIAEARAIGVNSVGGQSLDQIQAQLDAHERILKVEEEKNFYLDQQKSIQSDLDAILSERNSLVAIYAELVEQGQMSEAEAAQKTKEIYEATAPLVQAQVDKMREFLLVMLDMKVITQEVYDALVAKLALVSVKSEDVGKKMKDIQKAITDLIVSGATNAFDTIATTIGEVIDGTKSWRDGIKDVGRAFLQFAADFLRQIAQMIIQQAILNALQGNNGNAGGGPAAAIASAIIDLFHTGTGYGNGRMTRSNVNPAMFTRAPKYHTGYSGLARDEQAAILKKNEAVLTANDPFHPKNRGNTLAGMQGGGGAGEMALTVINNIDPVDLLDKALGRPGGEKVFLNWVRENSTAINGALG